LTNNKYVRLQNKLQARIHLSKRSFDKSIPEGKTHAFNLTCNTGGFFPNPSEKLLSKEGAFTMALKQQEYEVSRLSHSAEPEKGKSGIKLECPKQTSDPEHERPQSFQAPQFHGRRLQQGATGPFSSV